MGIPSSFTLLIQNYTLVSPPEAAVPAESMAFLSGKQAKKSGLYRNDKSDITLRTA